MVDLIAEKPGRCSIKSSSTPQNTARFSNGGAVSPDFVSPFRSLPCTRSGNNLGSPLAR